jgi:hypothetical protein
MLAAAVLQSFAALAVPIKKVRYQMHADQTLIGADIVALEVVDGEVQAVHFVEAKYRSTADTSAAEDAHEQLSTWYASEFADILFFIASRLEEQDPTLYQAFFNYLSDQQTRDDKFHIVLVWEAAAWTDTVLANIPRPPDRLEPMMVRTVLVQDLAALTQATFERMRNLVVVAR